MREPDAGDLAAGARLCGPLSGFARARLLLQHHLVGGLVLAQALERRLADEPVRGPAAVLDVGDEPRRRPADTLYVGAVRQRLPERRPRGRDLFQFLLERRRLRARPAG